MRTVGRIGRGIAVLAAAGALGGMATPAGAGVTVVGGTPEQRDMARWAVHRFQATGFILPREEIRFHEDRGGCRGRSGYYSEDVASFCLAHLDTMAARTLLHELAHGWVEHNVTGWERERFLAIRGLSTWNAQDVDWDDRGFEHAAEIIAWGIGDQSDGTLAPSIPRNSPGELADAYEALTGRPLPDLEAWMLWEGSTGGPR
jgi:hypothetical protein